MRFTPRIAVVLGVLFSFLGTLAAADWPAFRGSQNGFADDKDVPAELSKDNILWKKKLPGPGASSPIIYGDKIFISCYTGYGLKITKGFSGFGGKGGKGKGGFGKGGFGKGEDTGGDQKNLRLGLVCLDKKGEVLWHKEIEPKLPELPFSGFLREHGYASATPVTDGERVFVFFGKSGVVAFDMGGKQLWHKSVGTDSDPMRWGSAASPILYKNLVIVNAAIESGALVALDKKTGDEVWRTKGLSTTWASPILVETKDGKHEIVLSLTGKVVAYEPEKGKELWHCEGISGGGGFGGGYTSSTPVARDGVVYAIGGGGFTRATALAVKTGGKGDVSKTHVLWRKNLGASTPSPVLAAGHLCWVNGSVTCLKAADGETAYQKRLCDNSMEYVSAVAAADKVYALTRFDGLFVIAAGGEFKKLAHLQFEGDTSIFNASPAISDGRLYVRSNEYLYCIGKK